MGYKIKFSVHRNLLKDADGSDTYQVRHEACTPDISQKCLNQTLQEV